MSKMIIIEGNSNDKDNVRVIMVKGEKGEKGDTPDLSNYYTKTETDSAISDAIDGLGTIFNLLGSVATVQDLPSTGNTVGDVWYVQSQSSGYVWINDGGTLRWEQLGATIDLTNYYTKTETDNLIAGTKPKYTTLTLTTSNWVLNSTTNYYEYAITNASVTVNDYIEVALDLDNQAKLTDCAVESYTGGYKFITSVLPTENITANVLITLVEVVS